MTANAIQFLNVPPSREVAEQALHPNLRNWFTSTLGKPTLAQRFAWPAIHGGSSLLLSAPTGSGKTLAAFLPILSRIVAEPAKGLQCLYVAPLKALCRDVGVNLKKAWRSIQNASFFADFELRIGLRTGETSQRVRRRHLRHPPAILMTTPESFAQMLAHGPAHELLRTVRWTVLDEIHAMVDSKRGADLAISIERLEYLKCATIQRIGLSATCAPLSTVAKFLVGVDRTCTVARVADGTQKSFAIEPLFESVAYSPGWIAKVLDRLEPELDANRTTLVFTNTRNLAERLTWGLRQRQPERKHEIAAHHSSISAARRRTVERRLKQGRLWTVVSSTSLELGIDIGTVDHVIFVHPPGGVVRLLQRVGRSGHRPDEPRRGLLLTASPGELLEATVTANSGRDGQIECVRQAPGPLDVLCQHLVGMAISGSWKADDAFDLVRRAAPYRELTRREFDECLDYLSGRRSDGTNWLPARLCWHGDAFTIVDERTAKLLRRNLGTILTEDTCAIRLHDPAAGDAERTKELGEVDLSYAERLQPGDRFVLDGRCLELRKRNSSALVVDEVFGRPQVPRWLGTGVPMPNELARRIFLFRARAGEMLRDGEPALLDWLREEFHLNETACTALSRYFHDQETVSAIPTLQTMLIECVTMQSCMEGFIHTPLARSTNDAIARVLIHRWKRDARIDALALPADLGIYLVVQARDSVALEHWRQGLRAERFADELQDHIQSSELLRQSFASIAQTALMVLRNPLGRKRKVGGRDWAERRLFDQIQDCSPDFILLREAQREASTLFVDLEGAMRYVERLSSMPIQVRHLPRPSPFGDGLAGGGNSYSSNTAGRENRT